MEICADPKSLFCVIVERKYVVITFNVEKLHSADAAVIGIVYKICKANVTFGNTSCNLLSDYMNLITSRGVTTDIRWNMC